MQNTYTGEIRIDPPLTVAEVVECPFFMLDQSTYPHSVRIEAVEGDAGPVGTAIVPTKDDPYKGYDALRNIQAIVDRYGAGRTFTGHLCADGEESGDVRRFSVRDGRAVETFAELVWPDDVAALVKAADDAAYVLGQAAEGNTVDWDNLAALVDRVREFTAQFDRDGDGGEGR